MCFPYIHLFSIESHSKISFSGSRSVGSDPGIMEIIEL